MYEILNDNPVARFYYQGSHTHPVRRTVVLIEENDETLTGYEIREGRNVRYVKNAPIKSYSKNKISNFGDYSRLKMNRWNYAKADGESTLSRANLENLVMEGV